MSTRVRPAPKKIVLPAAAAGEPRAPRAKIVDVARAAGVSITTVSHALNGRGQVDPRTREAVRQAALQLGYRPNRNAQRLRSGASNMVALMSSMPFAVAGGPSRLGFLMEIAAVAASVALERGLALVLVPPTAAGGAALDHLEVDGAIVIEPAAADPQLLLLAQRGVPVITIGRQPGATRPHPWVDLRVADTTRQLLEHLHARGARQIALITGQQQRSPYMDALVAYDAFALDRSMPNCVVTADENQGEEAGRHATLALLARHPGIDAICAPVDAFAVGAARALRELGRVVPGQVMLATRYDGVRARACDPALTALDLHLDTVAVQAIELLLQHMRGETKQRVVAAPNATLVERQSTGAGTAPLSPAKSP